MVLVSPANVGFDADIRERRRLSQVKSEAD
jgi:hypothetical protein